MADATHITKTCTACRAEKPLDAFSPDKLGKYGRRAKCKPCVTALTKARYQVLALPPSKVCFGCALEKPASEFYRQKYSPDGLTSRCRPCHNKAPSRSSEFRQAERAKFAHQSGRRYRTRAEVAALAEEKRLATLPRREANKAWRWWLSAGASTQWLDAYWSSHPKPWTDKRLSRGQAWSVRNKVDLEYGIRERLRAHVKKQRRAGRLQWCMTQALKNEWDSPTVEAELGYSIHDLRVHLERQFKRGMTWDKFVAGEIHIDHIVPTVFFDLSKPIEIRACYALANLQPLWAGDNMQKGSRRLTLL